MQRVEGEPAAIEAPAQPPPPPPTCDGVESWSGEAACVDSKGLCQVGADAGGAPMAKADCETKSGTFSSTAVYVAPPPPPPYVEPTVEWEEVPRRVTLNFTCDPTQVLPLRARVPTSLPIPPCPRFLFTHLGGTSFSRAATFAPAAFEKCTK